MALGVCAALKDPDVSGLSQHLMIQGLTPFDASRFTSFRLPHCLAGLEVTGFERQYVRYTQASFYTSSYNEGVCGHKRREYMAHLDAVCVGSTGHSAVMLLS